MLAATAKPRMIHPPIVRVTHWLNAIAVTIMIGSGWQIYDASPLFPFRFPAALTIGGWLGGALLWHFAAMWLLMANGALYLTYGIVSGRLRRKLLPLRPGDLIRDIAAAMRGKLAHAEISTYNAVQRAFYIGVILALILIVLSGLAIWKPVQLEALTTVFGGYQSARVVHFLAMSAIAAFILVHVAMALLVPRSLLAMLRGR